MTQAESRLASLPPSPFKTGSQNDRVYRRIKRFGKVKNIEILYGLGGSRILNTTGRASSVRKFLSLHGIKLRCEEIREGVWEYSIQ